jgi:ABC-type amino acid transport substrate-binding protein
MRTALKALLIAGVLGSAAAWAKKPTDFREPTEMTEADFAAAREAKKGKLTGYDAGIVEEKPREIPWMLVALAGICIAGALPFALKTYTRTAKEIKTSSSQLKNGMDESIN